MSDVVTSSRRLLAIVLFCSVVAGSVLVGGCRDKQTPVGKSTGETGKAGTSVSEIVAPRLKFVEVAEQLGIQHVMQMGAEAGVFSILEVMGGGLAAGDFDADGQPDLYCSGGGTFDPAQKNVPGKPCRLFWNRGERWQAGIAEAIPEVTRFYSIGVHRNDLNQDGWDDLVVTGYGGAEILINQGDGSFESAPVELPTRPVHFLVASASGDLNGDGMLDLYLSNYCDWSFDKHPFCPAEESSLPREICGPVAFQGAEDYILMGNGEGGWNSVGPELGFKEPVDNLGKGMAVVVADWNQDRKLDIYVANDGQPNFLYINQDNRTFAERGVIDGVAVGMDSAPLGSMGVAVGDCNRDGYLDLVVTNFIYEPITLYLGRKGRGFNYGSRITGLEKMGRSYVSWGTVMNDFDLDGALDMMIGNGHVYRAPKGGKPAQPGWLFANVRGEFRDETKSGSDYWSSPHMARGLATLDYDGDLLPDVAAGMLDEPMAMMHNVSQADGRGLVLELVGTDSPRDPVGAVISLDTSAGKQVSQWISGGSYGSSHQRALFFGVPATSEVKSVEIIWPSGKSESFTDIPKSGSLLIVENQGWFLRPAAGS